MIFLKKYKFKNFIYLEDKFLDKKTCKNFIDAFELRKDLQGPGQVMLPIGEDKITSSIKKSTDIGLCLWDYNLLNLGGEFVFPIEEFKSKIKYSLKRYINEYPQLKNIAKWNIFPKFNIQKYNPSEAYFGWHHERNTLKVEYISQRMLVWTVYLNTVTDGGQLEFQSPNLKINAVEGRLCIFPADWTHTHRGIASKTQTKYIITGWFNYE